MVQGDLLQDARAQPVASAVAHIEHQHAAFLGDEAHQGGAHAAELVIALGAGVDGLVGRANGLFGCLLQGRRSPGAAGQQAQGFIHGQGTGDLSSRGAAHAVADNVNPVLDRESECIFVGRAFATAVGNRCRVVMN